MSEQIHEGILSLNRTPSSVVALIVLVGLCASAVMYQITAQGPGVNPDSIVYIEAARSLLIGHGFFVDDQPMTHFPPVFPLLLAVVGSFTGGEILLATRLLSALLFGINLALLAISVYMCARHSLLASACAILLFLSSESIISIHSTTWSEPLFIAFSMAGLILLSQHVVRPNLRLLVLASLMVGAAAATRYIGITLFPSAGLALLALSNQSFRRKVRDILLFSGVACLPLVSWVIRNMLIAKAATNREFVMHPVGLSHVKNLIIQMYNFVLPISIPGWTKALHVAVAATLFVLAASLLFRRTGIKESTWSIGTVLPSIFVIYCVLYVTFLFLSISFFDAHTPVDHRLLLPVFLALMIACTSVAKALSEVLSQKWAWYGYVFLVLFSVSINVVPAISRAVAIHHNGSGYTTQHWRESASLAYLARVPETMTIYSNGPDVIRFLARKKATWIPGKINANTRSENEGYQGQISQMIRDCEKGNALIVYLDRITWRWYLPSKDEIESLFSTPRAVVTEDGVIYGVSVVQNKAEPRQL
jgi:hypothetical protein